MSRSEFMYINFWNRKNDGHCLDDLLNIQKSNFIEFDSKALIEYIPTITRKDEKTTIRKALIKSYPAIEYTGFVEFPDFIFFCVMFSPENKTKKNIRKLENILETVMLIKISNEDTNDLN